MEKKTNRGNIMSTLLQQSWGKLWADHERTKKLLTLFSVGHSTDVQKAGAKTSAKIDKKTNKPKRTRTQNIGLVLGPALFFAILFSLSPEGMSKEALAVLASTIWIAVWWITEAIPIAATSLLPAILFPLTGAVEKPGAITGAYAEDTIFLFLGGFIIAIAMEKWNLHKRIALNIIALVGTSTERIILGFMLATGFISMWISNTATAMMMMPIALAVITQVRDQLQRKTELDSNFEKSIMLAVGYAASIGGLGTLIGTPPNTIFAGVVKQTYGIEITFAEWMALGVPIVIILLLFLYFYLVKFAFPIKMKEIPGGREVILQQKTALGKISFEEKLVLFVFLFAAFSWISRSFILQKMNPGIDDTMIALVAGVLLFLLPSKKTEDGMLLNWSDTAKVPWGVLLLFGGGLAIAKGFIDTGLAAWIGKQLTVMKGINFVMLIAVITVFIILLSEVASNTAAATMMYPIMASLAAAINVHPFALMVTAGLAASCAFMLPVATPPNAIVFGTGYLKMNDMIKAGFWLNVASTIVITISVYYLLPFVWDIDLNVFPKSLK